MSKKLQKIKDWEQLARESKFRPGIMAAKCPVSLRHLQRFFVDRFNATPRNWSSALRSRLALQLISQGWSNKAVAAELGFADESHFCHEFKRAYGQPPQSFAPLYGEVRASLGAGRTAGLQQTCRI